MGFEIRYDIILQRGQPDVSIVKRVKVIALCLRDVFVDGVRLEGFEIFKVDIVFRDKFRKELFMFMRAHHFEALVYVRRQRTR